VLPSFVVGKPASLRETTDMFAALVFLAANASSILSPCPPPVFPDSYRAFARLPDPGRVRTAVGKLFDIAAPASGLRDSAFQKDRGRLIERWKCLNPAQPVVNTAVHGQHDPVAQEILRRRKHAVDAAIRTAKVAHGFMIRCGRLT
jgi:hypothetical protein